MHCFRTLLLAATLAFAAVAPAQFTPLPNLGCPSGGSITTTGTPQLNQLITYQWFCPTRADVPFLMFAMLIPGGFPLPAPPACVAGCTLIFPFPPIMLNGPAGQGIRIQLTVPPDPSLVGQAIYSQGGCLTPARNCIGLGQGLETRFLP